MVLNPATHKSVLIQILTAIYSDNTIGPFLGFKGGTAAYLFYGLNRHSVDLDFDLLDSAKEDQVFARVEQILKQFGNIKNAEKKRFNLFYLVSYYGKKTDAQNVKVEINRRNFGSRYELKSYMGISLLVMIQEDMFANKLMAMFERMGRSNRDIFDVWFFAKNNWEINTQLVEQRSGLSFKEFLEKCIVKLEKFDDTKILDGMGELLDPKQKAWAKTKLKSETLFLLRLMQNNEA
ncbi:MAG: nucleotidyl transferase AbiEii/AbiGii toxin family protein [Candidatus Kerfeldbacteria bacterium]|nr:nucleotidyl transferase AbiEii/AbiGii toxin family protein [Candidatus Kerfeldbacteria bacterium]